MIKNALKYLVEELAAPVVQNICGEDYSSKPLHRISYNPKATTIEMNTLSSLVDYIRTGVDRNYLTGNMIVHVVSPTKVCLYSPLDYEHKREYFVDVNAKLPSFRFGQFINKDEFIINLQSKFIDDPETDKALLLKFAGTVESGTVAEYGDDGITQKATIKTGIASKGEAIVPSPARLRPFRTFLEIDQPASAFIFRMNQDRSGGVQCALFEADGGAWEIAAKIFIADYLRENLKEFENFIVIS